MAKKKKRRPQQRPRPQSGPAADARAAAEAADAGAGAGTGAGSAQATSRRQERKEQAQRDRERRIKQVRRQQRTRRLIRWGIVLLVILGIVAIVVIQRNKSAKEEQIALSAADRLNCTEVEEQEAEQPNEHVEPYAQGAGGVPAFGGNHTGGALPADPKVYSQQPPEETAIHNLEHGYVIVYYSNEADTALDEDLVGQLEDIVQGETEVLMSPYAGLAEPLTFVAWGARQSCDPPGDASPEDLALVTETFIEDWKNGPFAPEAQVA